MHCICFSPTGSTKFVANTIVNASGSDIIEHDVTDYDSLSNELTFSSEDCVLFATPVYSGRVPKTFIKRLNKISGNKTKAAIVAVYGNRHYDDCLLELKTILEGKGFIIIAAAAFIAKHNIVTEIAKDRPNSSDIEAMKNFGEKLPTLFSKPSKSVTVAGNKIYREYQQIPIKPHANSSCNLCGLCAKKCPESAIPQNSPNKTEKAKCVTCMRCVNVCPQKARGFNRIEAWIAKISLKGKCKEDKKPEIFIS